MTTRCEKRCDEKPSPSIMVERCRNVLHVTDQDAMIIMEARNAHSATALEKSHKISKKEFEND
jgi:hypothetical protein